MLFQEGDALLLQFVFEVLKLGFYFSNKLTFCENILIKMLNSLDNLRFVSIKKSAINF